ncbi:hypothetical protein Sjap_018526 [Stephania japonica]|uniref:F-box domain-containing protein n=1 Tax=Stephania japonica TaxID=461633 RepID=A0AAP0I844_9MAGN
METSSSAAAATETATNLLQLPQDSLHQIFSGLPLRQVLQCRSVCRALLHTLSSPSFLLHHQHYHNTPSLPLLSLRPSQHHHHHHHHNNQPPPPPPPPHHLLSFDLLLRRWLRLPLHFLPFPPPLLPVTSSPQGLLFLWAPTPDSSSSLSLVAANPITRTHRVLPPLGSAWSRHGTVLAGGGGGGGGGEVIVLTEIAALVYGGGGEWRKYSTNLPSKPRSPVAVGGRVVALCDVGSPWRSHWKMYWCPGCWEGGGGARLLMVGGLKSSFSINAACSTIVILRLDLGTLQWDEAGRMPPEMFTCFQETSKFKVFGGGERVCFSARRLKRLAVWDCSDGGKGDWTWIDGVPESGDGLCRGFFYEASLTAVL